MTRLALMVRGREMLGGSFRAALARHEPASPEALAAWADGAFTLANVNAGPGSLLLLFRMTAMAPAGPRASAAWPRPRPRPPRSAARRARPRRGLASRPG